MTSRDPGRTGDGPPAAVGAVVLAAGRSSRMGGANKLLEVVEGLPVVARVADAALAAGATPVVLVTGHDAGAVEAALAGRAVEVVENPRWAEGMSTSLAAGLAALEGRVAGALVCLGDMPRVTHEDLQTLIDAFRRAPDAAAWIPVHDDRRGNPVLWSARRFGELRRLEGDRGARVLLARLRDQVVEVPVAGPGVLVDVDTQEALERVRRPR